MLIRVREQCESEWVHSRWREGREEGGGGGGDGEEEVWRAAGEIGAKGERGLGLQVDRSIVLIWHADASMWSRARGKTRWARQGKVISTCAF